ncbi:Wiskott-Aldrich syndrome protein [Geosmithia morbida]|uniref:Wiskott-Aldrich syndrome protein n=1 Tax=Geosmithia morbida TaxID=1094350 RepID=A0A9P4YYX5_9HYPO|nr:Wiskott-Aldrich syndrome protein [Geosmithia morbida]KAF4124585.1 Wiskott-Aldrich syndrome protein [Geosmithia morbida]
MPSILNDDDKATVKRFVPKQSNKIQAVAVARLYVAYPNRSKWTYTGLQGAIVLADDLVGHTYWLKMVDISPANRGVIWDQEIFDTFAYNQDRTFFHTFEIDECLAGLSFVDEKEARQFKKRMDDREKNASKATRSTPFGGHSQPKEKHGILGGLFGSRHSSGPTPPDSPRNNVTPPMPSGSPISEFALLDEFDPLWREHFGQDLKSKGLTDNFIKDNQEFIVDFLREEQQKAQQQQAITTHAPPPTSPGISSNGHARPPPPPPPGGRHAPSPPASGAKAPPPPAPRRSTKAEESTPPPPTRPRFNAPPALPDAGKFAVHSKPAPPPRSSAAPPPPPRAPAKEESHKFSVPPPFAGQRHNPPPPPSRGPAPPPPPRSGHDSSSPIAAPGPPPPLPPKVPAGGPPPLPPSSSRPRPMPPRRPRRLCPPRPAHRQHLPPLLRSAGGAPPAPPPPPPPNRDSGYSSGVPAPALPNADNSRAAMLGDIQKAGGIGALKKVDRSQIRDRSGAQVGDTASSAAPAGGAPGAPQGGMADALAAALQKRKEKVSRSDDESDNDDW